MVPVALSDVIAVGEVPTPAEIIILAKAGFKSLLNTQPDGEVDRMLPAIEVAQLATAAGLAVRHVPVPSRRPPDEVIETFAAALADMPRPIYACCYSGSRAAAAWAFAAARAGQSPDAIQAACKEAGYDVSFLAGALTDVQQRSAAHVGGDAGALSQAAPIVIPVLKPTPVPRAASAGGFAVAG